jgi:hypothetical protein
LITRPKERTVDLAVFRAHELPFALRALASVVGSNRTITRAERRFLEVIAELHGASAREADLAPIDVGAVARSIREPHQRKRLVQLALIASMIEGEVTCSETAAVDQLAGALAVDDAGLRVLRRIAGDQHLLARFDMARRGLRPMAARAYAEQGFAGIRELAAPALGSEDAALAWRYRALGLLPEGTLGREYWTHCTRSRFAFPGEKGGIPERLVFHDFGHVLSGYGTTPADEICQGAFQAGFVREDGFAFLMFVVIQFHLGIRVTPAAAGEKGLFDVARVMRAAQRGAQCRVDLSRSWDPFEVAHRPVAELRAEYGIPAA